MLKTLYGRLFVSNTLLEFGCSGEDGSVNAVIIPRNWGAMPSDGRCLEEGIALQFLLSK
jgi:hypothetical protein